MKRRGCGDERWDNKHTWRSQRKRTDPRATLHIYSPIIILAASCPDKSCRYIAICTTQCLSAVVVMTTQNYNISPADAMDKHGFFKYIKVLPHKKYDSNSEGEVFPDIKNVIFTKHVWLMDKKTTSWIKKSIYKLCISYDKMSHFTNFLHTTCHKPSLVLWSSRISISWSLVQRATTLTTAPRTTP